MFHPKFRIVFTHDNAHLSSILSYYCSSPSVHMSNEKSHRIPEFRTVRRMQPRSIFIPANNRVFEMSFVFSAVSLPYIIKQIRTAVSNPVLRQPFNIAHIYVNEDKTGRRFCMIVIF
jgi:hypothetical protein